jgi:hypothetical protein
MLMTDCTAEKCASCDLTERAKKTCQDMSAIVDRMAQTPVTVRSEVHKEEVTVLVYEAIRALFMVAGSIDVAVNVVGGIMDEFIGKLRRAEAQSLVDKVLKAIDKAMTSQPPPPGAPIGTTTGKGEVIH